MTVAPDPADPGGHLIPLPGTGWSIWRDAVLRTTGFPADGLLRLAAADCASVADAYLDGRADEADFAAALRQAIARGSRELHAIASDPLLREAVTWQNRSALSALDGIVKAGPEPARKTKHRYRERMVVRYWQRYCGKTETIGFFGPVCWAVIDPAVPSATVWPGPALLRDRRVFLEHWALASYADRISADPRVRLWLPPALSPQLNLDGARVVDLARSIEVSPAEQAVLALCDGRRPALQVARVVLAQPGSPLRTEQDVYLALGRLAERGLLRWHLDLPVSDQAAGVLACRIAAIGDAELREQVTAGLAELLAGRDMVAAAAGDPAKLAATLDAADASFTRLTGTAARHRHGEMYAARTICVEDTTRDLQVVIGGEILEAVARPLGILLQGARWVSATIAQAYLAELHELYAELAAELGTPCVPLGQLWFLAQGLFYGAPPRPADRIIAEYGRRLCELYGFRPDSEAGSRLTLTSDELSTRVASLFPATWPGYTLARIHSPDLMIGARDVGALRRGEFTVMLGELHVAMATCASALFVNGHPDPARLRAAWAADVGTDRVQLLVPEGWPRNTVRLQLALGQPDEPQIGFTPAPGADPDRLLPVTAMSVTDQDGVLVATAPGGRSWTLAELFSRSLSEISVDAFKQALSARHVPRISIDRLVVARETWQATAGEVAAAFAGRIEEADRYLAVRRWRRELGLPERVYVSIGTETKPVFADLTSPFYVSSLAAMVRAAMVDGGGEVPTTVTEMLPDCGDAWVPDTAGHGYLSELRLHAIDPQHPRPPGKASHG